MSAIWDSDTGHVTVTATKTVNGVTSAVNLAGTTSRTIIVRDVDTGVSSTLAEVSASSDLANGVIVADAGPLDPGTYQIVARCVDATKTETYPSADQPRVTFTVVPDVDAA